MNGDHIHDDVLLGTLEPALQWRGAETRRQVLCRGEGRGGYVDMTAHVQGMLLAIEAELSARRVANDFWKAAVLEADLLWIVVPNHRVLSAVRREAKRREIKSPWPGPCFLTLGQALQQVTHLFPGAMSE